MRHGLMRGTTTVCHSQAVIPLRNENILKAIVRAGFKSINQFCKQHRFHPTHLGKYINSKLCPLSMNGDFKPIIKRLAKTLKCLPEDLFDLEQLNALPINIIKSQKIYMAELIFGLHKDNFRSLEELFLQEQLKEKLGLLMSRLSEANQLVINLRYGLTEREHSIEEIAKIMKLTGERVRKKIHFVIEKLRKSDLEEFLSKGATHANGRAKKSNFRRNRW